MVTPAIMVSANVGKRPHFMRIRAVLNPAASSLKTADLDALTKLLRERFAHHGHDIDIETAENGDIPKAIEAAASDDAADAVLAAGGDGTISLAASLLQGTGKVLAVLPGGNMNFFARSLRIPLDLDAAVEALASGQVRDADVAFANERCFIHEFSLGLHPEMIAIRDREEYASRIGKIIGSARSLWQVMQRPPRVRVWLDDGEGRSRPIAASALAISNNPFSDGHLPYADRVDQGILGIYVVRTAKGSEIAALAAGLATGGWADAAPMEQFTAKRLKITHRRPMEAAVDGELVQMPANVEITISPGALKVLAPDEEHAVDGQ